MVSILCIKKFNTFKLKILFSPIWRNFKQTVKSNKLITGEIIKKMWNNIKNAYSLSYRKNRYDPSNLFHNLLIFYHKELLDIDGERMRMMPINPERIMMVHT